MSNFLTVTIGKKFIVSLSGLFLILFLIFHAAMNMTAVFSEGAYNAICRFLGANWYAVAGTLVLAGGFVFHILYATILTLQNRRARGKDRYAANARPGHVEWSSKNMFVLGLIILGFLLLHWLQFWYNMMFAELMGHHTVELGGQQVSPHNGAAFIRFFFSQPLTVALYLIWYVALWFHLTHGFWSALQTVGWNNKVWFGRMKVVSDIFATVICAAFAFVTIWFFLQSLL